MMRINPKAVDVISLPPKEKSNDMIFRFVLVANVILFLIAMFNLFRLWRRYRTAANFSMLPNIPRLPSINFS